MNIILLAVFVVLLCYYLYQKYADRQNIENRMPPLVKKGKYLFGNYFDIDLKRLHLCLTQHGQSIDDLYRLKIFGQNIIVLNTPTAIHKILCTRTYECTARPQKSFLLQLATNNFQDLAFSAPTQEWYNGRVLFNKFFTSMKLCPQSVKHTGTQSRPESSLVECIFYDEWHTTMVLDLDQMSGSLKSYDLKQTMINTQIRIICTILFGKQNANDKCVMDKVKSLDKYAKIVISHVYEAMMNMQPLAFLFTSSTTASNTGIGTGASNNAIIHLIQALFIQRDLMKTFLSGRQDDINKSKSLLDVMIRLLDSPKNTLFNDTRVGNILTELIFAGIDTIVNSIYALFLYLSKHPHVQEKIYEELGQLCQRHDSKEEYLFNIHDKQHTPYTHACILETLRIISHIPLSIFRRTLCDLEGFGYLIPKDTILIPNLWKMHHDEQVYTQPYSFQPERFINLSTGKLVDASDVKLKNFMPFGCGKRVCPGKNIAINLIFLYLTNMVYNYEYKLDGQVNDDPRTFKLASNIEANPYRVHVKKRDLK